MVKNRHRVRMVGTIFIAFLCGTLALLWPEWREELQAKYGHYKSPPGQLPDFPGSKVLISGPSPVEMKKAEPTKYIYKIILNANFDKTKDVVDIVPSLFNVLDVRGTCGISDHLVDSKSRVTDIDWNLGGCDNSASQSLTITMETSQIPGSRKKPPLFEPKACGPVYLNDGAYLVNPSTFNAESKSSNSLFVAACLNESDIIGCVDNDNDGWSVDCGDCDDSDPAINPGAQEVGGDGIDNNCNGQIDAERHRKK